MVGQKKKNIRWNTMGILAGGFLGVILLGGVLLWMPFSNRQPIEFMDALFTSVSAVCVTGLVTITPAFQFTLAGQDVYKRQGNGRACLLQWSVDRLVWEML